MLRNEAKIFATRLDTAGFGLELLAPLVEIEFLVAEAEGMSEILLSAREILHSYGVVRRTAPFDPPGGEDLVSHAQLGGVEVDGGGYIAAG